MSDFFENTQTTQGDSLLPSDSDRPFGAYVTNEYLNVTKIINDTNFFTFCPVPLMTYYWNIVKRNLEWYNGYVWGIHNIGILSSHIGSKICQMSSQLTISGGYRIEGDPKVELFLSAFNKKKKIAEKLKQKLPLLNAIGFMLAKVDIDSRGRLDINFIQGNRYFAQVDDLKNVLSFYCIEKAISADVKHIDVDDESEGYYLVEERYFKRSKPIQRYRIYKGPVIASSPIFSDYDASGTNRGIAYEELPLHVQKYISRRVGLQSLGKEFVLPFEDLGAEIILNSYSQTGMDEYACFSDSTLSNVHSSMYELDLTRTQKNESKYLCQDFVAMPDSMISGELCHNDEQRAIAYEMNSANGFNKRLVKTMRLADPAKSVPFIYQPLLKTETYNQDLEHIYNEIAAGAQFSPITLAGFLHNGVEKTATEVTADENATRLTIQDKRELISSPMNRIFERVLKHYGYVDTKGRALEGTMVFNNGSLSNPKLELDLIEKKLQNGLISKQTAIMLANPQYSKREASEEMNKIKLEGGTYSMDGTSDINVLLGGQDDG